MASPATRSTPLPRMPTGASGSEQTPMARRGSNASGFTTYSIENRAQRGWVAADLGRSARDAVRDRRPDRRDQFLREQPVRAGATRTSRRQSPGRAAHCHGRQSRIIWAIGGFPRRRGCTGFLRVDHIRQLARVRPRAVYTTRDGLTGDRVYYAFEDSRGDIWLGTNPSGQDVVTRWQRATGSFRRYSTADGLRTATDVHFAAASAFAEDAAGHRLDRIRRGWTGAFRVRDVHILYCR